MAAWSTLFHFSLFLIRRFIVFTRYIFFVRRHNFIFFWISTWHFNFFSIWNFNELCGRRFPEMFKNRLLIFCIISEKKNLANAVPKWIVKVQTIKNSVEVLSTMYMFTIFVPLYLYSKRCVDSPRYKKDLTKRRKI